jgi:hypothetical protein
MFGLELIIGINAALNSGYWNARLYAMVGKIRLILRLSSKSREQKKLAPSRLIVEERWANVFEIVDLPQPAIPFSQ